MLVTSLCLCHLPQSVCQLLPTCLHCLIQCYLDGSSCEEQMPAWWCCCSSLHYSLCCLMFILYLNASQCWWIYGVCDGWCGGRWHWPCWKIGCDFPETWWSSSPQHLVYYCGQYCQSAFWCCTAGAFFHKRWYKIVAVSSWSFPVLPKRHQRGKM